MTDQSTDTTVETLSEISLSQKIYEQIPFCDRYDDAEVLDIDKETNPYDWRTKNSYLQSFLFNMGAISSSIFKAEESQLVGYTFPKESEMEAALLFTTREYSTKQVINALSEGIVREIPYFGILLEKEGGIYLCLCIGVKDGYVSRISIDETTEEERNYINMLLRCWSE